MTSISAPEIKKLWGRAAGVCSYPDCNADLLPLVAEKVSIIGEMAHIIAREPGGPRGELESGANNYDNLILLCPTHHTLVDKEAASFPADELRSIKSQHEGRVRSALATNQPKTRSDLFLQIRVLLAENHQIWKTWGPESEEAKRNPVSSAAEVWTLRKLDRIVPNNRKIIDLLRSATHLLSPEELRIAFEFIEHAEAFEGNCYNPREGAPRFPRAFGDMVNGGSEE